jgi:hypothetical protein
MEQIRSSTQKEVTPEITECVYGLIYSPSKVGIL